MAIGTPVQLGTGNSSGTSTTVLTTSGTITAGDLVVVFAASLSSITPDSVTDSAGNTYTPGTTITNGVRSLRPFWCANAAAVASGGTITLTRSGSTGVAAITAISVSGMDTSSPKDFEGAGSTGTGTGYTINTGTLAQADELICNFTDVGGTVGVWTESGSFNANTTGAPGTDVLRSAYRIVAATTTIAVHPTWTTSRAFAGQAISFKAGTSGFTGTGAATLVLAASASGVHGVSGTGATTLTLAASASGTHVSPITGTGAATLVLTASGAGLHGVTGTGAKTLTLGASGSGVHGVSGIGAAVLALGASASGVHGVSGTASATLAIGAAAAGAHGVSGTGAATLVLTASATGTVPSSVTGTGAALLVMAGDGQGAFGVYIAQPIGGVIATAGQISGTIVSGGPIGGRALTATPIAGGSIIASPIQGATAIAA